MNNCFSINIQVIISKKRKNTFQREIIFTYSGKMTTGSHFVRRGDYRLIERLSCYLEKVFAVCFTDQCLARLKQSFSLFPARKLLIWGVNSSIAQSHCCISNDVKAKLSRKFHGEMTFLHPRSLSTLKQ